MLGQVPVLVCDQELLDDTSFPNVSSLTVSAVLKAGVISPISGEGSWVWREGVIYQVTQQAGGRVRTGTWVS